LQPNFADGDGAVKGKRTTFAGERCSMARALGLIGDPWSLLIVRDALRGSRRFGEFQKSLGLAKNILADRLRKLVAIGVLALEPAGEGGRRNDYVLTEKGERLSVVLVALAQWGECYAFAPDEIAPQAVDRRDGKPVRLQPEAADGRQLGPRDVILAPGKARAPASPELTPSQS
jgi:DNA-binding HxlR family transcriptional regulator